MSIETMRTWKIGDVEITRIVEVNNWEDDITMLLPDATPQTVLAYPWLQPHYATSQGKRLVSFQCFVMRTREHRIMLDTCIGSDRKREFDIFTNMRSDFLSDLASAGFEPEAIDLVLCRPALRPRRLEYAARRREVGADVPGGACLFGRREYESWKMLKDTHGYHDLNHMYDAGQRSGAGRPGWSQEPVDTAPRWGARRTLGRAPGHVSIGIESRGKRARSSRRT